MRAYIRIDYTVGNDLTPREADGEAALARTEHLSALFSLLRLIDIKGRWRDEEVISSRLESLTSALENLGELGEKISDGLYANVCELFDAYKKAESVAANMSTILDDAETGAGRGEQ